MSDTTYLNLILCHIGIDKISNHDLIWDMLALGYFLKKVNCFSIKRHCHLDALLFKDKFIRWRQKVFNDPKFHYRSVSVLNFFLHKFSFLSTNQNTNLENKNSINIAHLPYKSIATNLRWIMKQKRRGWNG